MHRSVLVEIVTSKCCGDQPLPPRPSPDIDTACNPYPKQQRRRPKLHIIASGCNRAEHTGHCAGDHDS